MGRRETRFSGQVNTHHKVYIYRAPACFTGFHENLGIAIYRSHVDISFGKASDESIKLNKFGALTGH